MRLSRRTALAGTAAGLASAGTAAFPAAAQPKLEDTLVIRTTGGVFEAALDWAEDPAVRQLILVENPGRLFGPRNL